jgi:hypothetical protein
MRAAEISGGGGQEMVLIAICGVARINKEAGDQIGKLAQEHLCCIVPLVGSGCPRGLDNPACPAPAVVRP